MESSRIDSEGRRRHLLLRVIRQVLVEIRQRVGVTRQLIVNDAPRIPSGQLSKSLKVHHVQRTDMIVPPLQMALPKPGLPKAKAFNVFVRVAEWGVREGGALEVHVPQLAQVSANDLIRVDVDDFLDVKGEEHV